MATVEVKSPSSLRGEGSTHNNLITIDSIDTIRDIDTLRVVRAYKRYSVRYMTYRV